MPNEEDDVVFDEEASPADTLRKLREKLKKAVEEKQSYLDGWQRSQADFINMKRELTERLARAREEGQEDLLLAFLPTLDALTGATGGEQFAELSKAMQKGLQNIEKSFRAVLSAAGLESYDGVGEIFDPRIHESVSTEETSEPDRDHTIARVLQKGWRRKGRVLRPASVQVYSYKAN